MRQRALQIGRYPRQMTQILRLAVAPLETGAPGSPAGMKDSEVADVEPSALVAVTETWVTPPLVRPLIVQFRPAASVVHV